jgi:hypothetical protein
VTKMFTLLLAGALLVPQFAISQTPPSLIPESKTQAKHAAPPSAVVVPLCIGTTFNATLEGTLDSRKSKAGDPVSAVVSETVMYQGSVIFPKGTKVLGHVVRTSTSKGEDGAGLFVQFDKAVLRDGQEVLLNAGIQALVAGNGTDLSGPQEVGNVAVPSGPVEEPAAAAMSSDGRVVKSATYTTPVVSSQPSLLLPTAEGGITRDGRLTPESKGALGSFNLNVYTPTSAGSHGTVLLSTAKRVHLDNGTRLLLVVQPPSSANADATVSDPSDIPATTGSDPNNPPSNN